MTSTDGPELLDGVEWEDGGSNTKTEDESKLTLANLNQFKLCYYTLQKEWSQINDRNLLCDAPDLRSFKSTKDGATTLMRQVHLKEVEGCVSLVPVSSIDEAFEVASRAHMEFPAFVKSCMEEAGLDPTPFDMETHEGCVSICPTLKKRERVEEKVRNEYCDSPSPAVSWVMDIVRGMVVFDKGMDALNFVRALQSSPNGHIVRLKNRCASPLFQGYRDVLINIQLQLQDGSRHICELQIHFRPIKVAAIRCNSHATYEFFRSFFAGNMEAVANYLRSVLTIGGEACFQSCEQLVDSALQLAALGRLTLSEERDLASLVHQMGKLDLEAKLCDHMTTRIMEAPIHLRSDVYSDLAWSYSARNKLEDACDQFATALDLIDRTQEQPLTEQAETKQGEANDDHENEARANAAALARALIGKGNICERLGRLDEAILLFNRAIALKGKVPDLSIAMAVAKKSNIFAKRNDFHAARAALSEALELFADTLGPERFRTHLEVGRAQHSMGITYLTDSNPATLHLGLKWFMAAAETRRRAYGPLHARLAQTCFCLATLYTRKGCLDTAIEWVGEALVIWSHAHTAHQESFGRAFFLLGQIKMRYRRFEQAHLHFSQAQKVFSTLDRAGDQYTELAEKHASKAYALLLQTKQSRKVSRVELLPSASVLICNIANFVQWSADNQERAHGFLTNWFDRLEGHASQKYGVRTIGREGNCYMALSMEESHADDIAAFGVEILQILVEEMRWVHDHKGFEVRVGVNSGPVRRAVYVGASGANEAASSSGHWCHSDTVNVASRMETTARNGTMQISAHTKSLLKSEDMEFRAHMGRAVKGKPDMDIYEFKPKRKRSINFANQSSFEPFKDLDLKQVGQRVVKEANWDSQRLESALNEYILFLYNFKIKPNDVAMKAHTEDIDEIWRAHIVFTKKYADDCSNLFGYYLHYSPTSTPCIEELPSASVLVCDIVNFVEWCAKNDPRAYDVLTDWFRRLEGRSAETGGIRSIRAVGDCYMALSTEKTHADDMFAFGVDILEKLVEEMRCVHNFPEFEVRVGVHSGPVQHAVYAGGLSDNAIDTASSSGHFFGDTVNMAFRMESTTQSGTMQFSASTKSLLHEHLVKVMELNAHTGKDVIGKSDIGTYEFNPERLPKNTESINTNIHADMRQKFEDLATKKVEKHMQIMSELNQKVDEAVEGYDTENDTMPPPPFEPFKNLNLESVAQRVNEHVNWDTPRLESAINEYRRWLYLTKARPSDMVLWMPAADIDEIWHAHILRTRKYIRDCHNLFGHYAHHDPTPDEEENNEDCEDVTTRNETLKLYASFFKERPALWYGNLDLQGFQRDEVGESDFSSESSDSSLDSVLTPEDIESLPGLPPEMSGCCFNGSALVSMADGSLKPARDVCVGDALLSPALESDKSTSAHKSTIVRSCIKQLSGQQKEVVRLGDFWISKPHRIFHAGKWCKPFDVPGARLERISMDLHNFIVDGCCPIMVEGIIASTIGGYCPPSHDLRKPLHWLWSSHLILKLFESHPAFPNVVLEADDQFLRLLKNQEFAKFVKERCNGKLNNKLHKYKDMKVHEHFVGKSIAKA